MLDGSGSQGSRDGNGKRADDEYRHAIGESEDLSVVKQSLHDYQSLPVGAIPVASR